MDQDRAETPNPWYHHQKRKLILRYQKHLLEQDYAQREQLHKQDIKKRAEKKLKTVKIDTTDPTKNAQQPADEVPESKQEAEYVS